MSIKTELLVRFGIAIFLLFFVGKVVGPLLLQYFFDKISGDKKKRKNVDIDVLIANKEQMLRGDNPKKTLLGKGADSKNKKATETAYLEASKKSNDYTAVLELLDAAKWGEGKAYGELKTKLSRNFGFNIDLLNISKATNFIIRKDLALSIRSEKLPNFDQLADAIQTKVALDILLDESRKNGGQVTQRLAKKYRVGDSSLRQAFELLILEAQGGKKDDIYQTLFSKKNTPQLIGLEGAKWEICCIKILLGATRERFTTKQTFYSKLSKEALIFESLTPLPSLNPKKDFNKAYKLLNCTSDSSDDDIKKSYKKLAASKHPDKIASAGLPKSLDKIAHENFATIQTAYDMIKKKRSK